MYGKPTCIQVSLLLRIKIAGSQRFNSMQAVYADLSAARRHLAREPQGVADRLEYCELVVRS